MQPSLCGRAGRIAVLIGLLSVVGSPSAAQEPAPPSLKAAFLLNFAKFAEWPRDASGSLTLCVMHDRAAENALAQLVGGVSINGRAVTVGRATTRDQLSACHLVYLASDDLPSLEPILAGLRARPVLTVGDGERFARHGGIVGLLVEGNKVRFAINPGAAQRSGLRLSSRLLALATLIDD
jgi:hypothetical protein